MDNKEQYLIAASSAIFREAAEKHFLMSREYESQGIFPIIDKGRVAIANLIEVQGGKYQAFVQVEKYAYYLVYTLSSFPEMQVEFVDYCPSFVIQYSVICDSIEELLTSVSLKPVSISRKGELDGAGRVRKTNGLIFYNDLIPDQFETKIERLDRFILKNSNDIAEIVAITGDRNIWINVDYNYRYSLSDLYIDFNECAGLRNNTMQIVFDISGQGH